MSISFLEFTVTEKSLQIAKFLFHCNFKVKIVAVKSGFSSKT